MSKRSTQLDWLLSMSFVADSPAKTSAPRAEELAWEVLAAVCGLNSVASWPDYDHPGSSSRMWRAVQSTGLTRSAVTWNSSAMKACRSRLRRAMSVHGIVAPVSSLLPTLTGGKNMASPSMQRYPANKRAAELFGQAGTRGPLNPTWLEWFMGFPAGWTESGSSETR